ncbi:hypothetical protein NC651_007326 [Populus alba x Populus x berolinensis]|nr:hypothetical protein NC651_007326 [Populus alba x Populus x berolinensis]
MQSLAAFCETLIPPLPVPSFSEEIPVDKQEAIRSFYKASGPQYSPVPDEIGYASALWVHLFGLEMAIDSQTGDNSGNKAWEAIGYQVDTREKLKKPGERPLQRGIIETAAHQNDSTLIQYLIQRGLQVMEDPEHTCKVKCDL